MHSLRRAAAISLALMLLTGSALAGGTWRTLAGDTAAPVPKSHIPVKKFLLLTFFAKCFNVYIKLGVHRKL